MLLISLGWSLFALVASGLVLVSAFRESVEKRFDETLAVYLSRIVGQLADIRDQRFGEAVLDLDEPRFVLPFYGWYWVVVEQKTGEVLLASESLAGDTIDVPAEVGSVPPGRLFTTSIIGPTGTPLRLAARRVAFENGQWYVVAVTADAETIAGDTARFTRSLVISLGLFAGVLVGLVFVQWRVSLRPLNQLGSELQAVYEGRSRYVGTRYPIEIMPVAEALNTLIDANHSTLERARQHVGNLAHALKTPLSVLVNDASQEETPLGRSVREQTQTMQAQVRYYLERAQMAAKERMIGAVTDVVPVTERLHRAMARLGERRGVTVHLDVGDRVRFAGEQQDFEEIVGNLVDNALKWAAREVVIDIRALPGMPKQLQVTIEDDGPGLSEGARVDALSRGKRLDQSKPGSGLGLSIVAELVTLYGGRFSLDRATIGGLRAVVALPRA
jgi:signal transduction histidine kinase